MSNNIKDAYPPYNFSWVIPGKLAGMGCPQTRANLQFLVNEGIHHLVTLSSERRPPIMECLQLKRTEIAVEEFEPPTIEQIGEFIEICLKCQTNGEAVGVHCRQGIGRTGVMLAAYLVYFQQVTPERAILNIRLKRPGSCETYEQEKIVCRYHDALRRSGMVNYLVDNEEENKER